MVCSVNTANAAMGVYFHGGAGFAVASRRKKNEETKKKKRGKKGLCRMLANESVCRLISVASARTRAQVSGLPVEDGYFATKWVSDTRLELAAISDRIAVCVDSCCAAPLLRCFATC